MDLDRNLIVPSADDNCADLNLVRLQPLCLKPVGGSQEGNILGTQFYLLDDQLVEFSILAVYEHDWIMQVIFGVNLFGQLRSSPPESTTLTSCSGGVHALVLGRFRSFGIQMPKVVLTDFDYVAGSRGSREKRHLLIGSLQDRLAPGVRGVGSGGCTLRL